MIAFIFCLVIITLTILRLFIDTTTLFGMIIRIMWMVCGAFVIVFGIIHLVKAKK